MSPMDGIVFGSFCRFWPRCVVLQLNLLRTVARMKHFLGIRKDKRWVALVTASATKYFWRVFQNHRPRHPHSFHFFFSFPVFQRKKTGLSSSRGATAGTASTVSVEEPSTAASTFGEVGLLDSEEHEDGDMDELDFPDSDEEEEDEQTALLREEVTPPLSGSSNLQSVATRFSNSVIPVYLDCKSSQDSNHKRFSKPLITGSNARLVPHVMILRCSGSIRVRELQGGNRGASRHPGTADSDDHGSG